MAADQLNSHRTDALRWKADDHEWDLTHRALIMGILNVTPDSFSDGGRFVNLDRAVAHGLAMEREGADLIDVGGESTRPGADSVAADEELRRVIPVIRALREKTCCPISIDTSKAIVAAAAIEAGAAIINDVTALRGDPEMLALAASSKVGVVLMHMLGEPRSMQKNPHYGDVVVEVRDHLRQRFEEAVAAGIAPERIILDPGIGFGKRLNHNLSLLKHLDELQVSGRPLLLGVSRKSMIGMILGDSDLDARAWPTVAMTSYAIEKGARLLRVHDVLPNVQAARMTEAILSASPLILE